MYKYILKRILLVIPILFGVSIITFSLIFLAPGDIGEMIAMTEAKAMGEMPTPEMIEMIKEHYGLNDPPYIQYFKWLRNVLHGDLGRSFYSNQPVLKEFMDHFVPSLVLNLASIFVAILISIPLGIISAVKQNSITDHLSRVFALFGVSVPNFWLALMLLWWLSVEYDIFPLYGYGVGFFDRLKHLILPAIVLGTSMTAGMMRLTRASMLEVLRLDYITAARGKGLEERVITWRHAFKNALIPVVTVLGLQFGFILAGSMIVETIFSWPGNGRLYIASVFDRDYPMIQGFTLIFTVIFVFVTLVVDITYSFIDPRIRYEKGEK